MIPRDTKPRWKPRSLGSPAAETTRTYVVITVTLLAMLGLGIAAVQSGAIDALNASGFFGGRP